MDPALAIVDRVLPKLEEQVGYRQAWRNALGARAYILNFKADHAAALAINERLVADYATDPQSPKFDHAVILSNLAASSLAHGRLYDALDRTRERRVGKEWVSS